MTIVEITTALRAAGKPTQRRNIYNYINILGIKPSGARQRPQQYPADTAERIKAHFGIGAANLVTMKQLRAVKARANRRKK